MSRLFNALTGRELATVVLAELRQLLDLDTRFDRGDPVSSALVTFTVKVDGAPAGEAFTVQVSHLFKGPTLSPVTLRPQILELVQRAVDGDLRFGQHLTYPTVTCDHRLRIDLTAPTGERGERTVDVAAPDPFAAGRIDTRVPPAVDSRPDEIAALEARLATLRASVSEAAPVTAAPSPPLVTTEFTRHDYDPTTATGLALERGWKPSPGAALAGAYGGGAPIGMVQTREAIEHIELGVSHPPAAEGGLGAADAVRRAHQLPVPATQTVGGQIVDLPLGSF